MCLNPNLSPSFSSKIDFLSFFLFSFVSSMFVFLHFVFVGLEADLEDSVAQSVPIEGLDCNQTLIIVGHGDKSKSFTLVGLQIPDNLDVLDSSKGAKKLPQDVLLSIRS